MKKIFAILMCAFLICTMTVVAFAGDEISTTVDTNAVEVETLPTETEIATEGEFSGTEDVPTVTTETIVKWVETHLEEISVIVTVICTLILTIRKLALVIKSIVTCNNNTVSVAENSNNAIQEALEQVKVASAVVGTYKDEIVSLLAEVRQSDVEKKKLETALTEVENYLKTAKLANVELSNEVAELLVLANIPNAKKEELYSRHRAAVDALEAADHIKTEVKKDVGEEA